MLDAIRIQRAIAQHARPSQDGVHRRPEFMRKSGEEQILRGIRLFGLGSRLLLANQKFVALLLQLPPLGGIPKALREAISGQGALRQVISGAGLHEFDGRLFVTVARQHTGVPVSSSFNVRRTSRPSPPGN